jgi:hypothetical protein
MGSVGDRERECVGVGVCGYVREREKLKAEMLKN